MSRLVLALALCFTACTSPRTPPLPVVRVEVWHDTVCPWCRIGLHNLETAAKQVTNAKVEIVHHAFLLEPNAPPEGEDLRGRLAGRYGSDRLEAMFARVTQVGASYGVRFDWEKVRVAPNSAASHALIDWAPADKKSAVVDGIHRAYFEQGQNLGDPNVLGAIAKEAGLDEAAARAAVVDAQRLAAVRTSAEDASRRGISGVPFFVIGGKTLNGAQSPGDLRAAIVQGTSAKP